MHFPHRTVACQGKLIDAIILKQEPTPYVFPPAFIYFQQAGITLPAVPIGCHNHEPKHANASEKQKCEGLPMRWGVQEGGVPNTPAAYWRGECAEWGGCKTQLGRSGGGGSYGAVVSK